MSFLHGPMFDITNQIYGLKDCKDVFFILVMWVMDNCL